ncbi:hypothetical protein K461DRAFT_274411 [Myriangium duriaei CBS 260.36]|uniref:Thioesterase domain-containing protein n=1 Tax=Myriangium duriaei CBS 260.36 TaxID=1168546 RepID=A0A9P4JFP7_9PEZI|nr:hypothetical protein K461DRAFT_274411 [Myriangium duriaei CBS 260.36]
MSPRILPTPEFCIPNCHFYQLSKKHHSVHSTTEPANGPVRDHRAHRQTPPYNQEQFTAPPSAPLPPRASRAVPATMQSSAPPTSSTSNKLTSTTPNSELPGIRRLSSTQRFFSSHPFTAPLLHQPDINLHIPSSLTPKSSTEDSLFATALPHPDRLTHSLAIYPRQPSSHPHVDTCTVLFALGSGLNGFPAILHGGVVCTLLDEAAGVLLNLDKERAHFRLVAEGKRDGETPHDGDLDLFTTKLDTRFRAPVQTPGVVAIEVKVEERTERGVRLRAEMRQGRNKGREGGWGQADEVVCATADMEFKRPRQNKL